MNPFYRKVKLKQYTLTFSEHYFTTKKKLSAESDLIALMMSKDIMKDEGAECSLVSLYNETDKKYVVNRSDINIEMKRLDDATKSMNKTLEEMAKLIKEGKI